jgi:hypothetical protein
MPLDQLLDGGLDGRIFTVKKSPLVRPFLWSHASCVSAWRLLTPQVDGKRHASDFRTGWAA